MSWADAFDLLTDLGHRRADVLGYTLHQFRVYLELGIQRLQRDRREALSDAYICAAAAAGEPKAIKAFNDHMQALAAAARG